jgi:hypothetical protein
MADGWNNIYIDSSFYSDSNDGEKDIITELYLAEEADKIGNINIPTVFLAGTPFTVTNDNVIEFYSSTSTLSGSRPVAIAYFNIDTTTSGSINSDVDFYCSTSTISGSFDKEVNFTLGDANVVGEQRVVINTIIGELYESTNSTAVFYWNYPSISGSTYVDTQYTTVSGTAIFIDRILEFITSSSGNMNPGSLSNTVDLTFSGWVPNDIDFDVISSLLNKEHVDIESTVISGSVLYNPIELYCTVSGVKYLNSDLFCCTQTEPNLDFESTVISGSLRPIYTDLWSAGVGDPYFGIDVDIYPLYFSNFYLDTDGYTSYSGIMSVDVYDDSVYNITLSGTYFKVNGEKVPVTFSNIPNGYTMYYDPGETFNNFEGSTTITAHTENSNGDALDQDFYLTFGYIVSYENYDKINYGFNNQIYVRMSAENQDSCPVYSSTSYWFGTKQMTNKDLGAQIVGMPIEGEGDDNLSASIYPQSNAYFYEKTFRVVLTANDFNGNEMEPYEFEFEIENPNN